MADEASGQISQVSIEGEVVLEPAASSFEGLLRVRLIEASYADAPSRTVAETVTDQLNHRQGTESRWPFRLSAEGLDPRGRYLVTAHLSRSGSEQVAAGDYRSFQSHPVETGGPIRINVPIRPVG